MAVDTINTAITTRQQPDGGFLGPAGDGQSEPIATFFFGVEFGTVYQLISPYLDSATRMRWQASLAAAADFLVSSGNATWWANGNINLGYAELLYLVWRATGNATYLQDYNNEWTFIVAPPQSKFPGAGMVIVKTPTKADGSDGAGYLTETGPGGTGFDAEYTSLQLDVASRLFLLSGDPRALRIANLEVNMLLPRLNSSMDLDASDGTRHTLSNDYTGFLSSAFAVLSLFGGRGDLAGYASSEIGAERTWYSWPQDNPVMRRALGNDIALQALAESMYSAGDVVTDLVTSTASSTGETTTSTKSTTGQSLPTAAPAAPNTVLTTTTGTDAPIVPVQHAGTTRSSSRAKHSSSTHTTVRQPHRKGRRGLRAKRRMQAPPTNRHARTMR
jgi:hypothetical protein